MTTESAKVLISPAFGAGWSTWYHGTCLDDILYDEKLILAVEAGEDLGKEDDPDTPLGDFDARMKAKHGEGWSMYYGGARDLVVVTVHGPFTVEEYDGSESIRETEDLRHIPPFMR